MKRLLALVFAAVALFYAYAQQQGIGLPGLDQGVDNAALNRAYHEHRSGVEVEGAGKVVRLLPDDVYGSRHQKFILRLPSGQTLLVAHNIDLAPRLDGLRVGDQVSFRGEYEWNAKGGVVHWTHHDPDGRHPGGWLKYQGRVYQ